MHKSVTVSKRHTLKPNHFFASNQLVESPQVKSIGSNSARKTSGKKQRSDSGENTFYSLKSLKSKFKSNVIIYLKGADKGSSFSQDTVVNIQAIDRVLSLDQLSECLFKIFKSFTQQKLKQSPNRSSSINKQEKQLTITLRNKETKLIRLMKDESPTRQKTQRGKSARKLHQLQLYIDSLKKQLFDSKEEKQQLQKKMLQLIEEYKNRKSFYMAQIKKLTQIINMSSFDVRNLVLQKTKEAKHLQLKTDTTKNNNHLVSAIDIQIQETQRQENPSKPNLAQSSRKDNDFVRPIKGYNTQIRMLRGVNSIDHIDDNNVLY